MTQIFHHLMLYVSIGYSGAGMFNMDSTTNSPCAHGIFGSIQTHPIQYIFFPSTISSQVNVNNNKKKL